MVQLLVSYFSCLLHPIPRLLCGIQICLLQMIQICNIPPLRGIYCTNICQDIPLLFVWFCGYFPLHLWLGGNLWLLPLQDSSQLTLLGTFSSIRGEGFKMILATWSEYFSCLHLLGCVWTKFPAVAPTYEQSLIPPVNKYCTSEWSNLHISWADYRQFFIVEG